MQNLRFPAFVVLASGLFVGAVVHASRAQQQTVANAATCNPNNPECPHPQPSCDPNNPECKPPTPSCVVIPNNEYFYDLRQPTLDQDVSPAIHTHLVKHRTSFPKYSLPLSFLWESLGIARFLADPHLSCCDKGIEFTRIGKASWSAAANFVRSDNSVVVHDNNNPVLAGTQIILRIPGDMKGLSLVGGGFDEFRFEYGHAPHLTIVTGAHQTLFDSDIGCFHVSDTSVSIKTFDLVGTQQHPSFFIHSHP